MEGQTHDRHEEQPQEQIETEGGDGMGVARAHMAHTAFAAIAERMLAGYFVDGQDYLSGMRGTLSHEDIRTLPDALVIEVANPRELSGWQDRRSLKDRGPDTHAAPVMRLAAERRAEVAVDREGQWGDVTDIAATTEVPVEIVRQFIARNRHKIGNAFAASEMRRRIVDGRETTIKTEHFSPQFVAWAIESLRASVARYENEQARRLNQ